MKEEGRRKKEEDTPAPRGFRKIIAWQKAQALASSVFSAVRSAQLPPWLVSQVMRAALSVPANIAEGYTRGAPREYLRFLNIARSSLAELESHLDFMAGNGLLQCPVYSAITRQSSDVSNILVGLIRSIEAKAADGSWETLRVSEPSAEYLTGAETLNEVLTPSSDLPPSFFLLPRGEG